MKNDKAFADAMREATRVLQTSGAVAATRVIQEALRSRATAASPAAESSSEVEVLDAEPREASATDRAEVDIIDVPFSEVGDPYARQSDEPLEPSVATPNRPAPEELSLLEARGSFERKRVTSAVGTCGYKLYVPACYSGAPLPLVVLLHGCTQDANAFSIGTRANQWAESARLIVAYPEQVRRANASRCWNWFRPQHQQRGLGEPAIIASIVEHVAADVSVDRQRVYAAGLSAGGSMAAVLAQAYPDVFAAVGVHSGLPAGVAHDAHSALQAMRSGTGATSDATQARPLIVIHGDTDRTVHPSNAQMLVDAARASYMRAGVSLTLEVQDAPASAIEYAHRRTRHVDPNGKAVIEQWQLHGLGHAWAGGNADASHVDARGPDATRSMFAFFAQHALSGATPANQE